MQVSCDEEIFGLTHAHHKLFTYGNGHKDFLGGDGLSKFLKGTGYEKNY